MLEPRWVRFESPSWRGPGRWVSCASLGSEVTPLGLWSEAPLSVLSGD
jgi:hypothetical protein